MPTSIACYVFPFTPIWVSSISMQQPVPCHAVPNPGAVKSVWKDRGIVTLLRRQSEVQALQLPPPTCPERSSHMVRRRPCTHTWLNLQTDERFTTGRSSVNWKISSGTIQAHFLTPLFLFLSLYCNCRYFQYLSTSRYSWRDPSAPSPTSAAANTAAAMVTIPSSPSPAANINVATLH